MTTALLTADPHLDLLCAAHRLCDVCEQRPWTQLAQYWNALVCPDGAADEPEPEEEDATP